MKLDDGIPAIPLWIDGHAWFSVFEEFIDIRETDGSMNYRVPKCGVDRSIAPLRSALDLQPTWERKRCSAAALVAELGACSTSSPATLPT